MEQIVKFVLDAGSYAPGRIPVDERSDRAHISYDEMVGFLATFGNAGALQVAKDLDSKVRTLLTAVANEPLTIKRSRRAR